MQCGNAIEKGCSLPGAVRGRTWLRPGWGARRPGVRPAARWQGWRGFKEMAARCSRQGFDHHLFGCRHPTCALAGSSPSPAATCTGEVGRSGEGGGEGGGRRRRRRGRLRLLLLLLVRTARTREHQPSRRPGSSVPTARRCSRPPAASPPRTCRRARDGRGGGVLATKTASGTHARQDTQGKGRRVLPVKQRPLHRLHPPAPPSRSTLGSTLPLHPAVTGDQSAALRCLRRWRAAGGLLAEAGSRPEPPRQVVRVLQARVEAETACGQRDGHARQMRQGSHHLCGWRLRPKRWHAGR